MPAAKPLLIGVDDDAHVLQAITQDLKDRYRSTYRVLGAASGAEALALALLAELKKAGTAVALLPADYRMPEPNGVQFLGQARPLFPEARWILLTSYSDTEAAIQAINSVQLRYYLLKPWHPPAARRYPVLDGQLAAWQFDHRADLVGLKLIGHAFSPQAYELNNSLAGNLLPYRWLEYPAAEQARELVELNGLNLLRLPALLLEDGRYLLSPSLAEVAARLALPATASAEA